MSGKLKEIIAGTGLMAAAYFVSRFLGLIREMVIAWKFGAGSGTDVYNASFLIPDALNYMLAGGAFSIVLIPMLSKYISETVPPKLNERGQGIFTAIFTPVTLIIILLTLLSLILTPWFSALLYPQFTADAAKFQRLVRMTRIILPAQIFFIAGGLINATLRARGDFRGNAWGPNIYNLGIILGGIALSGLIGIEGLSVGVLAGAFLGPFLMCYVLAGKTIQYRFSFDFRSPDLREYIRLNLPLMVGISLLTVDQFFIRYFGARGGINEGTITCLNYSRTVMLVPIALVGQAAGQVSLTYLSRLWQQGKTGEFSKTLNHTMRGVIFLSFLFAGGLFLVARPLSTLLFFRGAFTIENNQYTARLLQFMIFAVPAFAALQILVNGYYARKNTFRPMLISSVSTIISFFIYDLLSRKMGGPGIALAAVGCFWFIFLFTLLDYFRKYGRKEGLDAGSFFVTTLKAAAAAVSGIITVSLLSKIPWIHALNPDEKIGAVVLFCLASFLYAVVVFLVSLLLRGEEAEVLKNLSKKLFIRRTFRKS
jgi:putative peptidoglycan lipid II flippase